MLGLYIKALALSICIVATLIYFSAAAYFYRRKFDAMLKIIQYPAAKGRGRDELTLHERLNICASLVVWLLFPRARFGFVQRSNAMFSHLRASQIPPGIKVPLFLIFGSGLTVLLVLPLGSMLSAAWS